MKRFLMLLTALMLSATTALAVPNTMNYQGQLFLNGSPTSGPVSITFRMYDAETGGTLLWTETDNVTVTGGLFTTTLGDGTTFPATIFSVQVPWLEMGVNGTVLTPRTQFKGVPYTFQAQRADTANVALSAPAPNDLWSTDGTNVWRTSGRIGLGTNSPLDDLDLYGRFRVNATPNSPDRWTILLGDGTGWMGHLVKSDGTKLVTFKDNGSVGIGNPSPQFTLDVAGGDSRFQREMGSTDFIVSPTATDVRLFSQSNVPVAIGTNGDTYKLTIQGNGRINVKNALGIGLSTPWADYGIYLDAGSQTSQIAWDNRVNAGFQMYQDQGSNKFNFTSTGGGSGETWNFHSAGLGDLLTIGSTSTFYRSLNVSNNLSVGGNLFVGGTKCRIVNTEHFGQLKFNATESGSAWFTTEGEDRLVNGHAQVNLDPRFLEAVTIDDRHPFLVSVTFYGPHGNFYIKRFESSFYVEDPSHSDAEFSWEVKARQKGYEDVYLEPVETQTAKKSRRAP